MFKTILLNLCYFFNNLSISERIYTNLTNINIDKCFFNRNNFFQGDGTSNFGGIIYINDINCNLIISNTIFSKCTSIGDGGAIYFKSNSNGSSNLNKICSSECYTSPYQWYQFALIHIVSSTNNNIINFTSITNCFNPLNLSLASLSIHSGIQIISSINSTFNNVHRYSGFISQNSNNFFCNFCSFSFNNVTDGRCIYFGDGINEKDLTYSNFIQNICPTLGLIYVYNNNYNILNSIFIKNEIILFYGHFGYLDIINCIIFHNINNYYLGSVNLNINNSFTLINTYAFTYFSTFKCFANLPLNKIITLNKFNLFNRIFSLLICHFSMAH